jgi:hypothetical protein
MSGFVTLDGAMLRAAPHLQREYDLEVLSPGELSDFEEEPPDLSPIVATIQNAELLICRLQEEKRPEVLSLLRKLRISAEESREIWVPAVQGAHRECLTATIGKTIVAVAAWQVPTKLQRELSLYLYVDETTSVSERVIDHLIESASRASRAAGVCRLVLHTSLSQSRTRALAGHRGFRSTTVGGRRFDQLIKISIPEVVSRRYVPGCPRLTKSKSTDCG